MGSFVEVSDLDEQITIVGIAFQFREERLRLLVGHLFHVIEGRHGRARRACRGGGLGFSHGWCWHCGRLRSAEKIADCQAYQQANNCHRVDVFCLPTGFGFCLLQSFTGHSCYLLRFARFLRPVDVARFVGPTSTVPRLKGVRAGGQHAGSQAIVMWITQGG